MAAWMSINVISGVPLIFSTFPLYLNTPYICIIFAIVTHTLIYRKLYFSQEHWKEFFTLKSLAIFIVCILVDVMVGMSIVYILLTYPLNSNKDTKTL